MHKILITVFKLYLLLNISLSAQIALPVGAPPFLKTKCDKVIYEIRNSNNQREVIKMLEQPDTNINCLASDNVAVTALSTPLNEAIKNNRKSIINFLLNKSSIDVNKIGFYKVISSSSGIFSVYVPTYITPLALAISLEDTDTVKELLSFDSITFRENTSNLTQLKSVIDAALESNNPEYIELIMAHPNY